MDINKDSNIFKHTVYVCAFVMVEYATVHTHHLIKTILSLSYLVQYILYLFVYHLLTSIHSIDYSYYCNIVVFCVNIKDIASNPIPTLFLLSSNHVSILEEREECNDMY